jgi:ribosomal peptide maturation radical SAM protein 1
MRGVLLVNMPFAALDSPSLALGLFKSRLRSLGIPCDVEYLNLRFAEFVGDDTYELLIRSTAIFAGEHVFAGALFGSLLPPSEEYYAEALGRQSTAPDVPPRLEQVRRAVPAFLRQCLDLVPWDRYDVVGFTSMFEQNLPSLALASLVKQRWPGIRVVFGGANCEDVMGVTLHRLFPFVDFVCTGEADASFPELVQRLKYGHPVSGLRGVVWRDHGRSVYGGSAAPVEDIDALPQPDYDEYFERWDRSPLRARIRPSLLMESARGCWWGEKAHCTFCGLNGLTMSFRGKSAERTLDEFFRLAARYPSATCVRFTDNIMAPGHFKTVLPEIAKQGSTRDIIFEVKANLKKEQIKTLAAAGVTVQAGIESLSTHTLKLMDKGSNALMNIQTLKWCRQYGVPADWNLLYGFPGEQPEDYRRTRDLVPLLTHLDPPTGCGPIRLDRFSPNFDRAEEKGLIRVRPMSWFRYLYPFDSRTLADLVYYFDFDYRTPIDSGGHLPSIEAGIRQWQGRGDTMHAQSIDDTVVIRDRRRHAGGGDLRITGETARIYEFCDKARGLAQIREMLQQYGDTPWSLEGTQATLDDLVRRQLMVEENGRYLSLAVMTYESVFDRPEPVPVAPQQEETRTMIPLTVAGAVGVTARASAVG